MIRVAVAKLLQAQESVIPRICDAAGIPGAVVGILHRCEIAYKRYFGFRDLRSKTKAGSDTLYRPGWASRWFVAAAVEGLVADGKLEWRTTAKEIIPGFKGATDSINRDDGHGRSLSPSDWRDRSFSSDFPRRRDPSDGREVFTDTCPSAEAGTFDS